MKSFRCICPSLLDRRKRITANDSDQDAVNNNYNHSNKSSMFIVANCCIAGENGNGAISPLIGDETCDEQRRDDELSTRSGLVNHVNSRSRPLILPTSSNEWTGYNNESNRDANDVQLQQPKRQSRPTELFLPAKQLQNGHTNSKSENSSYIYEQFWVCTKRFVLLMSKLLFYINISIFFS